MIQVLGPWSRKSKVQEVRLREEATLQNALLGPKIFSSAFFLVTLPITHRSHRF